MATSLYSDAFTGNTETPLATHWSTMNCGAITTAMNGNNGTAIGSNAAAFNGSYVDDQTYDDSQYAECKMVAALFYQGVAIRYNTTDFYLVCGHSDGTRIRLFDSLGNVLYTWTHSWSAGDLLRIEVDSAFLISVYHAGGLVGTFDDATNHLSQSGKAGIVAYGIGQVDDFDSGNMAAGGVSIPVLIEILNFAETLD